MEARCGACGAPGDGVKGPLREYESGERLHDDCAEELGMGEEEML